MPTGTFEMNGRKDYKTLSGTFKDIMMRKKEIMEINREINDKLCVYHHDDKSFTMITESDQQSMTKNIICAIRKLLLLLMDYQYFMNGLLHLKSDEIINEHNNEHILLLNGLIYEDEFYKNLKNLWNNNKVVHKYSLIFGEFKYQMYDEFMHYMRKNIFCDINVNSSFEYDPMNDKIKTKFECIYKKNNLDEHAIDFEFDFGEINQIHNFFMEIVTNFVTKKDTITLLQLSEDGNLSFIDFSINNMVKCMNNFTKDAVFKFNIDLDDKNLYFIPHEEALKQDHVLTTGNILIQRNNFYPLSVFMSTLDNTINFTKFIDPMYIIDTDKMRQQHMTFYKLAQLSFN